VNIGQATKALQVKYPSASISRIRFLEKEGLINIKRSSGGTRKFTNKDLEKIFKLFYESVSLIITIKVLFA